MIFLTVGTWRAGYDRLVKAVDELVAKGIIAEQVTAQVGYGSYCPKHMTVLDFCSPDEFADIILKARIVISHAGMGTIIEAVKKRKPIIVVPRKTALREADNDHQLITAKQLEAEGKILVAYEITDLPAKLEEAKSFIPSEAQAGQDIVNMVRSFIDDVAVKKRVATVNQRRKFKRFWPYRILRRDDEDIKADLSDIMQHFAAEAQVFDIVVFVPNAGRYLSRLFVEIFDGYFEINFVTVRRASTVSKDNSLKQIIFKKKWLADAMRHIDVLLRLIRYKLGIRQTMVAELTVDFDVKNKRVLVIDDDLATGTTLEMVKALLLKNGASSVTTASISNHFMPDRIKTDYSVYRYALLRTKNSRDYCAK